jgi:general secretion pathway protein B
VLLAINVAAVLWYLLRADPSPTVASAPQGAASAAPAATPQRPAARPDPRFDPPLIEDRSLTMGAAPVPAAPPADSAATADATVEFPPPPASVAPPPEPAAPAARGAPSGGATPGLPTRDSLVSSGKAEVPNVTLSLHVFNADAAKRFAQVDNQIVREGDTLPNGMRVEQIVVDGVVMSFRGSRFLVPIQ